MFFAGIKTTVLEINSNDQLNRRTNLGTGREFLSLLAIRYRLLGTYAFRYQCLGPDPNSH
jgi:hypothetical protein